MISVIIPLYNKEPIIERSLRSVLLQDHDDFEVIIVDDGSTDGSADVVRSTADSRIVLINQENRGPSSARNTGVGHSHGEWVLFLDADDELLPGALRQFAELTKENTECNFFASPFYNNGSKERTLMFPYKKEYVKNPYKGHFFGSFLPRTGTFICKKDLLVRHPFNENIRRFEDLELLFRLYNDAIVYTDSQPSLVVNINYAAARNARKDIKEDFLGHLDLNGKSFWEKMCLYQLFLWERLHYPEQCKKLYPSLYKRWDLYLIYQLLTRTKKLWA